MKPEILKPYWEEAKQAIQNGVVKEIEFSSSTYQVLTKLPNEEEVWVFIQLDEKGDIKDAFCAKDQIAEEKGCLHLAIAYLSLYKNFIEPLHQRFERSLWNQLCRLFESRFGDNAKQLKKSGESFQLLSKSEKILFEAISLNSETAQFLDAIFFHRVKETEVTSLKFSNLTDEELFSWRMGRPNPRLRYDLSFWSDLAKWLMKKQEEGDHYELSFRYGTGGLPQWISIAFQDVKIGFYLTAAHLPLIVNSLSTVNSPIQVHNEIRKKIAKMVYDKHNHVLTIEKTNENSEKTSGLTTRLKNAIQLDGWQFIPGQGFFAEEADELLKRSELHGTDIPYALTEYTQLIASSLSNACVHSEATSIAYQLTFDEDWNFHVIAYLFEPGDLTKDDSWLMEEWAYLDSDGFYRVKENRFHDVETIILQNKVADFVTQNRNWLNLQEGFHTHIRSVEFHLSYQITENQRLVFFRSIEKEAETRQQDFGSWVYIEHVGFFSKTSQYSNFFLRPGLTLSPEQIPLFIKINREELSLIPHFFCEKCPISKCELSISFLNKKSLLVKPEYQLLPENREKKLISFDDFVYLENEGFYELPHPLRLPEKFRHPIEIEGDDLTFFLSYEIDQLYPFFKSIDKKLIKPKQLNLVTSFIERADDIGKGWYRFAFYYQTESGLISVNSIRNAYSKKVPFGFFEEGLIDLREDRFNWLFKLPKNRFEKKTLLLTTLEFMRIQAFDHIEFLKGEEAHGQDVNGISILEDLTTFHPPEQPNIEGLLSELRPYQEVGLKWLWFLYRQQLSGMLCDEMGLGKTHQAMALIASIVNLYGSHAEGLKPHFLIICPTSVLYHWEEKLHQFLPHLKICPFFGTKRSMEAFQQEYDILLTSYGILRNELKMLSKVPFELAIFDEIQIAKNQFSKVYSALTTIRSQMKVGLTGTPIENRLRELKSLFDIILPSYMPAEGEYREKFIKPIEREQNVQKKEILNRLIHPFILRRKKKEVLTDLPGKVEETFYCDLLPSQQELYQDLLQKRKRHLIEDLHNEKGPIPYLHIFALLSSLKQICDHPAVYLKEPEKYDQYTSGKWELFLELLREARDSQQKVVVFTQYLGMIDIIERYLRKEAIGFATLRGATRNRKEQLETFNLNPKCEVFIGSLQAAGLGIDLTAGSVVIHYDRWWNAARENQATDRVHRIGQTRGVQVFKLVTKGTFEEKIDAMIMRKGKLMEDIVGVDDQHLLKTFSRDELIDLLSDLRSDEEHPTHFDDDE